MARSHPLRKIFPYPVGRSDYLIHCSERARMIYVETPKVACSTIKRMLQVVELNGDLSRLPEQVHDRKASPLKSPKTIENDVRDLFFGGGYFLFSFVRNPYTRVLSAYLDKFVNNAWERNRRAPKLGLDPDAEITFSDFLRAVRMQRDSEKDIHWMPQAFLLQPKKISYDFIGRFENFQIGFDLVAKRAGFTGDGDQALIRKDDHKTNASDRVTAFVHDLERELILDIYKADFDQFGYSRDPAFAIA